MTTDKLTRIDSENILILPTALEELKALRRWLVRRADKVPLRAADGSLASSTNPADWCSYEEAKARCDVDGQLGLGFVLCEADHYTCIDLDDATDPKHNLAADEVNEVQATQAAIIQHFNSYTEFSPSGKGFHIWVKGTIPRGIKLPQHIIGETYSSARYMTVTGKVYRDLPIAERQEMLTAFYGDLQSNQLNHAPHVDSQQEKDSDDDVIHQASNAANGQLFKTLWAGAWKGAYPSQSEADLSLCNIIAFYTDNQEQVIRIFRASALGKRDKAKRNDYVGNMVRIAFDRKLPVDGVSDFAKAMNPLIQNVPLLPTLRDSQNDGLEVIEMADTEIERIEWQWEGYLPKGKLALVAGAGETGKTSVALSMAATTSNGGVWPDGTQCEKPGSVLIFSTEDDAPTTIFPRLIAMGANPTNIAVIAYNTSDNKTKRRFDPAVDMPVLERHALARGNVSLIIIDPITSAVTGDMNKTNEVRRGLQSVVETAAKVGCAVIGITHFTKNSEGRNPADRVIGSQAFAAYARMVLVAARDEQSPKRVLTRAKSNISLTGGGFSYSLREVTLPEKNIRTLAVVWGEQLVGSAREILATVEHKDEEPESSHTQTDEAQAFLKEALKDGPRYQKHLVDEAKERLGIQERTLQRARQRLGVTTRKQSNGNWMWSLGPEPPNNT